MKPQNFVAIAAAAAVVVAAHPAAAHVVSGGPGSLMQGFAHPFSGLDHVLAMVAVGAWAAHLGGNARWRVPASFVAAMTLAGAAAMAGLALPYVETMIALTVVASGALIFLRARLPIALGMALVAGFAAFHGLAHGIEAPVGPGFAQGLAYGLGFVAATACLHGIGLAAGTMAAGGRGLAALPARLGGGLAVVAGVALMAA